MAHLRLSAALPDGKRLSAAATQIWPTARTIRRRAWTEALRPGRAKNEIQMPHDALPTLSRHARSVCGAALVQCAAKCSSGRPLAFFVRPRMSMP